MFFVLLYSCILSLCESLLPFIPMQNYRILVIFSNKIVIGPLFVPDTQLQIDLSGLQPARNYTFILEAVFASSLGSPALLAVETRENDDEPTEGVLPVTDTVQL